MREVEAYKRFAVDVLLPVDNQDCLNAYQKHLLAVKPPLAPNTMQAKFMHINKWLKEAYGKKLYTGWFRGTQELKRPHEAYSEPDIRQLVEVLRRQSPAIT